MSSYKGHLIGGCIAYGLLMLVLYRYNPSYTKSVEWLFCCLAGSLFPDIDIKSKGQKYFYRFVLLLFCLLLFYKKHELFVCCSVIALIPMLVRHRGLFHELWFVVIAPCALFVIVMNMWPTLSYQFFFHVLFFIAGAISHLWLDRGFFRMIRRNGGYKRRL